MLEMFNKSLAKLDYVPKYRKKFLTQDFMLKNLLNFSFILQRTDIKLEFEQKTKIKQFFYLVLPILVTAVVRCLLTNNVLFVYWCMSV